MYFQLEYVFTCIYMYFSTYLHVFFLCIFVCIYMYLHVLVFIFVCLNDLTRGALGVPKGYSEGISRVPIRKVHHRKMVL